jgi:hypothetical protein
MLGQYHTIGGSMSEELEDFCLRVCVRVAPRGATRATSSAAEPVSLSLRSPRRRRAQPPGKACVVAGGGGPPPSRAGVSGWSGAVPWTACCWRRSKGAGAAAPGLYGESAVVVAVRAALRPGRRRLLHELVLWARSGPSGPDLGLPAAELGRWGGGPESSTAGNGGCRGYSGSAPA